MCEETEPKEFTSNELVYIAKDGGYGDAIGMLLLDPRTIGEGGLEQLNNAVRNGESLWEFVLRQHDEGNAIQAGVHVIYENGYVFGGDFFKQIPAVLSKLNPELFPS